jgi:sucrose phosphorylase
MNNDNILPHGVMFNAYPDSIENKLSDTVSLLKRPELQGVFSLFYILPTFFNSDLDRGFSVIDYNLNKELVSAEDLDALNKLGVELKFDLVLNHLSVGSPQFQDLVRNGDQSPYKDFFIDWNEFWRANGEMSEEGYIIPEPECLNKLFMRKPGLPILMIRFPDGSERPYWNTFYQEISYPEFTAADLSFIEGLSESQAQRLVDLVNNAVRDKKNVSDIDFGDLSSFRGGVIAFVEAKRKYLGQMDLNARSELVWEFYDETLKKLSGYGAKLIRLDAFAYLHKQPGETNFFNKPGTWEYLERIKHSADKYGLTLLPEIHSEYGKGLHAEVSAAGYPIYDFFFPGLVIDALDRGVSKHLLRWIDEIQQKNIKTINMLGCHDGIPVLDLKGDEAGKHELISRAEIDAIVDRIVERGGRVKNLFGPDGKKIAYYQVNATFFSALGEDEQKLLLARAIQMFMPGIPQVWYLDLFAGKNNYAAADKGGTGGHKEINRTTLYKEDIESGLKRGIVQNQLEIMRLRNTLPAFSGELSVDGTEDRRLRLRWKKGNSTAALDADLKTHGFSIAYKDESGVERKLDYAS